MTAPISLPLVIAIDGPSASGKGTVAQRVAQALGFHYLDSGALYRLVAVAARQAGVAWIDEAALVQSLDIGPEHMMFSGQGSFSPHDLGDVLDALFSWAGGYLDMQLYSYRGNIKIVRDEKGLADIYRSLYGVEHTGEKGFYVYEGNTLYLVADDFTKEIVGHEIAHAIISNFFVVQPPAKVQEVLAGYIEYQLRKKSPAVKSPSK